MVFEGETGQFIWGFQLRVATSVSLLVMLVLVMTLKILVSLIQDIVYSAMYPTLMCPLCMLGPFFQNCSPWSVFVKPHV